MLFFKQKYRVSYVCVVALFLTVLSLLMSSVSIIAEDVSEPPRFIRIGLVTYYNDLSTVHVYNHSIIPGFYDESSFIPESVITTSGDDFWFTPATRLYLESDQTFETYEQALAIVTPLREVGYKAYCTLMSEHTWKIFVGHKDSQSEIDTIKSNINGLNEVTYQNAPASKERVFMESESNYPIMFENRYKRVVFATEDKEEDANVLDLGKRSYRGYIEVSRYGSNQLSVVNVLDFDDYLYSVVASETYASWPKEALKAQSVAARSYAMYFAYSFNKFPNEPYDLDDTGGNSQVYNGYEVEDERINEAVDETTKQLIRYQGEVIPAYFFASSGGRTESSENVWSGVFPYLKSVPDIYEQSPTRYPWLMTLTPSDIASSLLKYGINVGTVTDLQAIGYSDAGRVMTLRVVGTKSNYDLNKEQMRYKLGIYSRKFTILKSDYRPDTTYDAYTSEGASTVNYNGAYVVGASGEAQKVLNGTEQVIVMGEENIINQPMVSGKSGAFVLAGEGWGHGVGMSQTGAKGMALEGYDYKEILMHYYSETTVE